VGVGYLREVVPSRPERVMLLHGAICDENSAYNGEALPYSVISCILDVRNYIRKKVIPWEVNLRLLKLHILLVF
jgi:hypothetical protein